MITKRNSLERLCLSNKPKVVITPTLKNQIDYLHEMVGSREWSGELITREEGRITDLDNWTITCENIFLADIGNGAFTGYEVDKGGFKAVDIVEMYDAFPGLLEGEVKNQHIHTHHSLGFTTFSGTDWENLEDRGVISNYFMMLIVDMRGIYSAKVAYSAKVKTNGKEVIVMANNQDGFGDLTLNNGRLERDVLVVMDCEIVMPEENVGATDYKRVGLYKQIAGLLKDAGEEQESLEYLVKATELSSVDNGFIDRYEHVKKAVEEAKKPVVGSTYHDRYQSTIPFTPDNKKGSNWKDDDDDIPTYGGNWEDGWGDRSEGSWKDPVEKGGKKQKKIMEMSDKEYMEYMDDSAPLKLTDTDACVVINACIIGNTYPTDSSNPMKKLVEIDKEVLNKTEYATGFIYDIRENFDILYPKGEDKDYANLLGIIYNKMDKYKNCKLVSKIIAEVAEERIITEQLIDD